MLLILFARITGVNFGCVSAACNWLSWLSYRCFVAKGDERAPLFGEFGLARQLGIGEYSRPRKFRERLEEWLMLVKLMWPECPARISAGGDSLIVGHGTAIAPAT
jgi:hypothetical protein